MSPRYSNVTSSIRGFDYTICITQSQIHLFKPTQRTSWSAPKFLPESQDENMCQPLCTSSQGHITHKLITKTYIKWITWISHCHHKEAHARHTSSVLKSLKTQSNKITSKGKLNPLQESRNIIRSNYNSKARDTSRSYHLKNTRERERERERDQTHSYWYIPSAPRVNYSLLVMESAVMMKIATGDGSPLWQGAGTGSRLVFGGYRGLRRRNSRSIFSVKCFRVYGNIYVKEVGRGMLEGPTR